MMYDYQWNRTAIPQNGPGSERMETYVVEPPEPVKIYYYRWSKELC